MLGRFRGAGQVGVLVRSFLSDGSGDVKIEDVLAGLDASKEMLVASVNESKAALNMGRGLHFISYDVHRGAMLKAADGKRKLAGIAERPNGVSAGRKGVAADNEVVRNVHNETVQITSGCRCHKKNRAQKHYK
jgi:hypothetical protein